MITICSRIFCMTNRELPGLLYPLHNPPVRFSRPASPFASRGQEGRILSELSRLNCISGIVLVFPYPFHPSRFSYKFFGEPTRYNLKRIGCLIINSWEKISVRFMSILPSRVKLNFLLRCNTVFCSEEKLLRTHIRPFYASFALVDVLRVFSDPKLKKKREAFMRGWRLRCLMRYLFRKFFRDCIQVIRHHRNRGMPKRLGRSPESGIIDVK